MSEEDAYEELFGGTRKDPLIEKVERLISEAKNASNSLDMYGVGNYQQLRSAAFSVEKHLRRYKKKN